MQEFKESEVVMSNPVYQLHQFSKVESDENPILILPPFAGRSGNIVQSLVNKCVAAGKEVYAYELKSATIDTNNTSVSDLIDIITECQSYTGASEIDLVGTCQGGWLASIYTALYPGRVRRLATFAAPINTKTGEENAIEEYCNGASMQAHKSIVALNGGVQPGLAQWAAFALSSPYEVFVGKYVKLWRLIVQMNCEDINKWVDNDSWYNSPQDLAGPWFLDVIENHFINNKLYNAEWIVKNRAVNLGDITCPVFVYSGEDDAITHPEQARALLDKVSSKETHYKCFPKAGHTKVFVGGGELDYFVGEFI